MKLYARIVNDAGRVVSLAANEEIHVQVTKGNRIVHAVTIKEDGTVTEGS